MEEKVEVRKGPQISSLLILKNGRIIVEYDDSDPMVDYTHVYEVSQRRAIEYISEDGRDIVYASYEGQDPLSAMRIARKIADKTHRVVRLRDKRGSYGEFIEFTPAP